MTIIPTLPPIVWLVGIVIVGICITRSFNHRVEANGEKTHTLNAMGYILVLAGIYLCYGCMVSLIPLMNYLSH